MQQSGSALGGSAPARASYFGPASGGGANPNVPSTDPAAGGTYFAPPAGTDQAGQDYTTANLAYQRALARFNQQRTGLLQQYGYKGTVDPNTGLMTNIGVDAGNSYGALQQLLHGQANEDQQAQYAAEDRGLVGGLAQQGEQELAYSHHGQSSALAKSLFGSLSDVNSQQLDAKDTLDQALWQLQHGATTSAVSSSGFSPAVVTGATPGSTTGAGSHPSTDPRAAAKVALHTALTSGAAKRGKAGVTVVRPAAPKANAYNNPKSKKRG